jgi:hypothetical protein
VYILIISLLVLVLFAALTLGLVGVLQELVERYCQSEPMFGEQGPIFTIRIRAAAIPIAIYLAVSLPLSGSS